MSENAVLNWLVWLNDYNGALQVLIAVLVTFFNVYFGLLTRQMARAGDDMLKLGLRQQKDLAMPIITIELANLDPIHGIRHTAEQFFVELRNVGAGPAMNLTVKASAVDGHYDIDPRTNGVRGVNPSYVGIMRPATEIEFRCQLAGHLDNDDVAMKPISIVASYDDVHDRRFDSQLVLALYDLSDSSSQLVVVKSTFLPPE